MKTTRKQIEKAFLDYAKYVSEYDLLDIFVGKFEHDSDMSEKFRWELAMLMMAYFTKEELLNLMVDDLGYLEMQERLTNY